MKYFSYFVIISSLIFYISVIEVRSNINPIDTLRVMTYNIHTGVGVDEVFDLERIADLITEHRIDIAGLQEIDQGVERTDRVDTMKKLSEMTGMYAAFGRAIYFQGGEYGNGLLTRFPIIEKHNHPYTFEQTGEHRALLYALLEYGQDTILMMNTHLDHRPDDAEQMQSVEEILSIASEYAGTPKFILGDINDRPDSRVVAKINEAYVDVWDVAGTGRGYTFHTENLDRRIDYIFYPDYTGDDAAALYLKPVNAYTIQTPASDHIPVVAEFEVYRRSGSESSRRGKSDFMNEQQKPTVNTNIDSAMVDSYQHIIFEFTAGRETLQPGGGFRIEIPTGYGETTEFLWDRPQNNYEDVMGYVHATASNNANIELSIYGVAGGIIQSDLIDAPLGQDETVYLHFKGRVQSLASETYIRGQWRSTAESPWIEIEQEPSITFTPQDAVTMVITAPADVAKDEKFDAAIIMLDKFGNQAYNYRNTVTVNYTDPDVLHPGEYGFTEADSGIVTIRDLSYAATGFQKITATDGSLSANTHYTYVWEGEPQYRRFFGDTHFHTGTGTGNTGFAESWADNRGGDHRGNFTTQEAAYTYIRDVARHDFASASEHDDEVFDSLAWRESQQIADSFYEPGTFTTFYAYEWTATGEHHVVLHKDHESMHFHSHHHETLPELWDALDEQGTPAITIPHLMWPFDDHTMWNEINNEYRKVGEIYSLWNNRFLLSPNDDPQRFELGIDNPWSYQYAWHRGHKIGLIGSSDNHLGQPGSNAYTIHTRHAGGLAAVLADENTREGIWHSFSHRRTYATSGTRIYLHFTADNNYMGSKYETNEPPEFKIRAGGTNLINRVELIKYNGEEYITLYTDRPDADISEFTYTDEDFSGDSMYYVRVIQADEYPGRTYADPAPEMAWSSPVWIMYRSE